MKKQTQNQAEAIIVSVLALSLLATGQTASAESLQATFANSTTTQTMADQIIDTKAAIIWPAIQAKSAFVYDPVGNAILFEKNADVQRPIASLTKVMTAATMDRLLNSYPNLQNNVITVLNMKNETPSDFVLTSGTKWLPMDLVKIMLIGSSNKAAETIASSIIPRSSFISLMNFQMKEMGLTKTYFRNPTGLTEPLPGQKTVLLGASTEGRLDIAAGVSTAREYAKLMWNVIAQHPGVLDVTSQKSITLTGLNMKNSKTQATFTIDNTNKMLSNFPILFSKTGFTDNAGGNLAVVVQRSVTSHPYVIVVLGSTQDKRFEDVAKLASTTLMIVDKIAAQK